MPITASQPTVISAQPEQTYDLWWIRRLYIDGGNPANVLCTVELAKYRMDDKLGVMWSPEPTVGITINDAVNNPDPNIQAVVTTLLTAIQSYGQNNKLI